MALPSVEPISLAQVLAEFAAPATTPLGDMLKGGAYVPMEVVGGTIPEALPISLGNFLGARAPTLITFTGASANAGSLTVTPVGDTDATLSHVHTTSVGSGAQTSNVLVTCNFSVMAPATPKVVLSARAENYNSGLGYFQCYDIVSPSPELPDTNGVAAVSRGVEQVTTGNDSVANWRAFVASIPSTPEITNRVTNGIVLTDTAVSGTVLSFALTLFHSLGAVAFSNRSHNATGRVRFRLSFLFVDGSNNIVSEVPFTLDTYTAGLLTVTP